MRFADGLKIFLFASTFAVMGCDDEEDDDTGGSGGSGGDRAAMILGLSGDATNGATVFSGNACATDACHGSDGVSGTAPSLMDQVGAASDEQIVESLLNGKGAMPTQASLSDQDLADVVAWLNENFS